MKFKPGTERGMKTGGRIYGKKHERKAHGRVGRKSVRTWLRANWRREMGLMRQEVKGPFTAHLRGLPIAFPIGYGRLHLVGERGIPAVWRGVVIGPFVFGFVRGR